MLFRAESGRLFRYACTLPGVDRAKAEDLVQSTFVAAIDGWARLHRLDPGDRRRWLHVILKRQAIDQWRKVRFLRLTGEFEGVEERQSPPETLHQVLCAAALDRVWDVISTMPGQRQKVAFLYWNEQWSTSEIAEFLGIAQSTVRVHLKLARDELIEAAGPIVPFMEDHGLGEPDGRRAGS
ncbi:RNA polymerase sigma factor [Actinomadura scrupuli]|uniref:RNA polymerase sigma factor n=1 Tax=Actinomadura scrupuli TaxID=559629 RepID=UPI003D98EC50